jgi:hypothetical protein
MKESFSAEVTPWLVKGMRDELHPDENNIIFIKRVEFFQFINSP